jgi:hypothetical protein
VKYRITSDYVQASQKFSFVVTPDAGAKTPAYCSDAIYESNTEAMIAGVKSLEDKGLRNIDWHAVVTVANGLA